MTAFSRRNLLRGAAVTAILGASWAHFRPMRSARGDSEEILTRHFGADLIATEPAQAFIDDYTTLRGWSRGLLQTPPGIATLETPLLTSFLQSTTAYLHQKRGDPFIYLGLFDPFTTPCLSQLNVPV